MGSLLFLERPDFARTIVNRRRETWAFNLQHHDSLPCSIPPKPDQLGIVEMFSPFSKTLFFHSRDPSERSFPVGRIYLLTGSPAALLQGQIHRHRCGHQCSNFCEYIAAANATEGRLHCPQKRTDAKMALARALLNDSTFELKDAGG